MPGTSSSDIGSLGGSSSPSEASGSGPSPSPQKYLEIGNGGGSPKKETVHYVDPTNVELLEALERSPQSIKTKTLIQKLIQELQEVKAENNFLEGKIRGVWRIIGLDENEESDSEDDKENSHNGETANVELLEALERSPQHIKTLMQELQEEKAESDLKERIRQICALCRAYEDKKRESDSEDEVIAAKRSRQDSEII